MPVESWLLSVSHRQISLSKSYTEARIDMAPNALTRFIDQQISYGYGPDVGARDEQGVIAFGNKVLERHPTGGILSETLLEPAALRPSGLAVIRVDGLVQDDLQGRSCQSVVQGQAAGPVVSC